MTVATAAERIAARIHADPGMVITALDLLTEAQIKELVARDDLTTLRQVQDYVRCVCRGVRPTPRVGARRIARAIVSRTIRGGVVTARRLSCGHVLRSQRRIPATSRTTAVCCPMCGSGTPASHRRTVAAQAVDRAACRAAPASTHQAAVRALIEAACGLLALGPLDHRRPTAEGRLARALAALGVPAPEPARA